ncbi:MAG: sulfotransferase [Planctomycetota bacterium]
MTPPTKAAHAHADQLAELNAVLGKQLFFVIGCQKSGTTWVQNLLDGHPHVRCHGEAYFAPILLPLLGQFASVYNQRHKAGTDGDLTEQDVRFLFATTVGLAMARWTRGHETVRAIGEKTPEHALCVPQLSQAFPDARFIHVIRDGRDVCVSGYHHNVRQSGAGFTSKFPTFDRYVEYTVRQHWVPYIQHARAAAADLGDRYLEVRYEDLHRAPEQHVTEMAAFVGVDTDTASIDACINAASFDRRANGDAAGETKSADFYRKGVVGDWANEFDDAALATFNTFGGELLQQLGYATDHAAAA